MSKAVGTDPRNGCPAQTPDKETPPLPLKSLKGVVSAAEWPAMRRLADRIDSSGNN